MKKAIGALVNVGLGISLLFLSSCSTWPYAPKQEPAVSSAHTSSVGPGILNSINTGEQICNPSISQDDANYPGCMLWLNFGGSLVVNDTLPGYSRNNAVEHDRLTISDSANNVRWYIKNQDMSIQGEFQTPNWSTHPGYITSMGKSNGVLYDGYAIRTLDKKWLMFNKGVLPWQSKPHLRVPDSVVSGNLAPANSTYDPTTGFVDRESIKQFFGTYDVKLAYSQFVAGALTIFYLDYNQATPAPVQLAKPQGRETWSCQHPLISPDGEWIVYNCYTTQDYYESYAQELRAGSVPHLVGTGATDPSWWIHPADPSLVYIVYAKLTGGYFVSDNLLDPAVLQTGSAGSTVKQQVKIFAGEVADIAFTLVGEPETIVNLPFKGGRSRDGSFLCTGYKYAYIMGLY